MIHLVAPPWLDDPTRPSGGNVYDRRVADALGAEVHTTTDTVPRGATVLVDGLMASPALLSEVHRLRVVVLVHMPSGEPWEGPVLRAAAAVVTTSRWTRDHLVAAHGLERVVVAEPGVDPAPVAPGSPEGRALLSVGAVTALKGYDVLATALALLDDLPWDCRGVGSTALEPDLAGRVGRTVRLTGPMTRAELDATYAQADLLVLASRAETYGMVVAEALAHGVPVIATAVGGVPEALGEGGVLVPPGDPVALATALRRWLTDHEHRTVLRSAARDRRTSLAGWDRTAGLVARALEAAR